MRCTKSRAFCIASAMAGSACGAVDEHVERAALARRRIAGRPQAVVGRLERPLPAQAPQPAAVLGVHGGLDRVAEGGVGVAQEWDGHGGSSFPVWLALNAVRRARFCAARASRRGSGRRRDRSSSSSGGPAGRR